MRTVTFKSVLESIAALYGDNPDSLTSANTTRWARFINRRLKKAWTWDYWPELTPCEQRAYRDVYAAGTAYAEPTATVAQEVYYPPAQKYYQALKATTNHAPATLSGDTYVLNSAYWAECAAEYSGEDWADATAYAVEDVVRNPADGRFYCCHTAHTSSSSLDATKFGILTQFEAYVSPDQTNQTAIGEVLRVCAHNPRANRRFPGVIPHVISEKGIVPAWDAPALVWVEFRRRIPTFTTAAWGSGTTYAIGDVVYYNTTGECYTAIAAGTNQNPSTATTYWRKNDMPYVLADYVAQAAYADSLRPQGKNDDAAGEDRVALDFLLAAHDAEFAGQGQYDTAAVSTY